MDKRFMIHVISEIVVIVGIVVLFFRKTSSIVSTIAKIQEDASTISKKLQELEKKMERIDKLEKIVENMDKFLSMPQLPQMQIPVVPPIHTFMMSSASKTKRNTEVSSGPRIVPFEEQLGISDEEEFVKVDKKDVEASNIQEIAEELAELELEEKSR